MTLSGGPRLVLPRLRIAPGVALDVRVSTAAGGGPGTTAHLMHLSGGRRVGGGTVRLS